MAKKIVITEVTEINCDEYKVVKGKYTHCYDCPFYSATRINGKKCEDLFTEIYGKSCCEIRIIPDGTTHDIKKKSVTLEEL